MYELPALIPDVSRLPVPTGSRAIRRLDIGWRNMSMRSIQEFLRPTIQLRGEFFHCRIFANNFAGISIMQSYLGGDRATENSLINIAKPPRHEASQPTDPGRGMSVAYNDAGAKDGEAGKTDIAHGVFLHSHYADISKPAASCASHRRKQAKLLDSGVVAAPRKCTNDAKFKSFQFLFGPARRTRADACAAHGADRTLS